MNRIKKDLRNTKEMMMKETNKELQKEKTRIRKNQSWACDDFLALRQRQHNNVTEPQGPVRDQKKFEK